MQEAPWTENEEHTWAFGLRHCKVAAFDGHQVKKQWHLFKTAMGSCKQATSRVAEGNYILANRLLEAIVPQCRWTSQSNVALACC